jgi:hypothetical protein
VATSERLLVVRQDPFGAIVRNVRRRIEKLLKDASLLLAVLIKAVELYNKLFHH